MPTRSRRAIFCQRPIGSSLVEYLLGLAFFSITAWMGLQNDWLAAIQRLWHYTIYLLSLPTI